MFDEKCDLIVLTRGRSASRLLALRLMTKPWTGQWVIHPNWVFAITPLNFKRTVPGPRRYILLASVSAETSSILADLLTHAGVADPLVSVPTDVDAVATLHHPDREPPVAVFVDVPGLAEATRLIPWIVSSPTTRLIPVFAIVGSSGPDRNELEAYKPTAIISHPLNASDIAKCIELSPLLRGAKRTEGPPPASPGRRSPPFSLILAF